MIFCHSLFFFSYQDLKPGNYLRDPHRLAVLEPQLSGASKILSPQPDLDPVVSVSTPPAVPVTVGGSASTSTPSVSLPPQPQFAFNDIVTSSLSGLAPHIIVSDHVSKTLTTFYCPLSKYAFD